MDKSQTMDMTKNIGYAWYQCECCPYGYHIDLDFVRYCETMGQQVERSGSIKRRKDRRRQRQSMEVLLGLAPALAATLREPMLPPIQDAPPTRTPLIQDALNDVVSDFEITWQRSKNKHNLPDVTAVTAVTVGDGPEERDFDIASSAESCSLSPTALQNIREQMALSLEHTKALEEKVKMIPALKEQVASLKIENTNLHSQLEALSVSRSQYVLSNMQQIPPPPPRRGVVGILTRDVGVGNQIPYTKSVATEMIALPVDNHVDRWFNEKSLFLNFNNNNADAVAIAQPVKIIQMHTSTQTNAPLIKKDANNQTLMHVRKEFATQTIPDQITHTKTIATNTLQSSDLIEQNKLSTSTISLASLSLNRSKSFHVVENKTLLNKPIVNCNLHKTKQPMKSTYSQYDTIKNCNKAVQCEDNVQPPIKSKSTHSQSDALISCNKAVQCESNKRAKSTDTNALIVMTSIACDPIGFAVERIDFGCNTEATALGEEFARKDADVVLASRIPRRQMPASPVLHKKFKRQNTYTIPTLTTMGVSALELLAITNAEFKPTTICLSKDKSNVVALPEVNATSHVQLSAPAPAPAPAEQNEAEELIPRAPTSPRKKCIPSREMQAAMKVINDSLQKNVGRDSSGLLKNANNLVQTEWFSMSSTVTADPLDVEDYLDCFEEYSLDLIQYVVNTVDTSGNTAMHYAVSHGNFDVVSILLDSKVCDINKQNKAGYTSVMLVSLAEVRSGTHAHVVRRLFSLADVNNRAKLHGQTALMLAVSHGRLDMVGMLLEAGADINIQDDDGSTALMCAAEHGHVEIVKHFLNQADCDSSITDVDGSTALKIAMEASHRHIGVLLYAHERHLHVGSARSSKANKSAAASPKTPTSSSPTLQRTNSHGHSQLFK